MAKTLETVLRIVGKIDPTVNQSIKKATGQLGNFNKKASVTSSVIKGILGSQVINKVVSGFKEMASAGLSYASDLQEVEAVVETIYGKNAPTIDKWAQSTQSAYGLNELAAKSMSSTFASLLKPAGLLDDEILEMSTGLVGLTGDLSAFKNLEPDEVFDKLKSGLMGNTEPMEAFGIDMRAAALEAYRLEKGIGVAYKEMGDGEQKILRYNYMMERLAYVSGMAEQESGNYAASLRNLKSAAIDASGKLVGGLLPALADIQVKAQEWIASVDWEAAGEKITGVIKKAQELGRTGFAWLKEKGAEWKEFFANLDTSGLQNLFESIKGFLTGSGAGMGGGMLSTVESVLKTIIEIFAKHGDILIPLLIGGKVVKSGAGMLANLGTSMGGFGSTISSIAGMLGNGKIAGSLGKIGGMVTKLGGGISSVFSIIASNPVILVIGAIIAAIVLLIKNWDKVKAAFQKFWKWFQQKFPNVAKKIETLGMVFKALANVAKQAWNQIKEKMGPVVDTIKEKWNEATTFVGKKVTDMRDKAKEKFEQLPEGIQEGIKGIKSALGNFLSGDWATAWEDLKNAAGNILSGLIQIVEGIIADIKLKIGGIINEINNMTGLNIPGGIAEKQRSATSGGRSSGGTSRGASGGGGSSIPRYATGGLTSGVTIAGEGRAPEWVIPTDPAYRSRAQSLLSRAADSLGMSSAVSGASNPSISVSYSPTINAGGQGGGDRAMIAQLLREDKTELIAILREEVEKMLGSSYDGTITVESFVGG